MSAPEQIETTPLGPSVLAEWRGGRLVDAARAVFRPGRTAPDGVRRLVFRLTGAGSPTGECLWMEHAPLCTVPSGDHLEPLLEKIGSLLAVRLASDWLVLHAGLVGRAGKFLLLPADRSSGKTTLCLALARAGWTYAGDDLVFFHPGRKIYLPFLKALTMKQGSFDQLDASGPVRLDSLRGPVRYEHPAGATPGEIPADAVRAVASPLYDPAAPAGGEIRPLAPELAALALVQQLVGGAGRGEGALEWIRELCALPCRLLRYPDAESSVRLAAKCIEEAG